MKKLKQRIIMLGMVLFLTAIVIVPVEAKSITLNHKSYTLLEKQTVQLKVKGTSKKVKWESSDKKIATVSSKGKVTAKKEGDAVITAKVAGKTLKCKITVESPYFEEEMIFLNQGDSYQMHLQDATGKVTWKVSKTSLAKISKTGLLTAGKTKTGHCEVIAKYKGKKYYCDLKVINIAENYETVKKAIAASPRTDADGNKCLYYGVNLDYPTANSDVKATISYLEDKDVLKCSYTSKVNILATDSTTTGTKADLTTVAYFNLLNDKNMVCQVDYYYNDAYLGGTGNIDATEFSEEYMMENLQKMEVNYNEAMFEELKKEMVESGEYDEVTDQDVIGECQDLCFTCLDNGFLLWTETLYDETELQPGDLGMTHYDGLLIYDFVD